MLSAYAVNPRYQSALPVHAFIVGSFCTVNLRRRPTPSADICDPRRHAVRPCCQSTLSGAPSAHAISPRHQPTPSAHTVSPHRQPTPSARTVGPEAVSPQRQPAPLDHAVRRRRLPRSKARSRGPFWTTLDDRVCVCWTRRWVACLSCEGSSTGSARFCRTIKFAVAAS